MFAGAVERLYAAFAGVARPVRVEGCPHCVDPRAADPLLSRPLRDLAAADLAAYGAKALSTWGSVDDFRYFAPRLLELAADDAFGWPDMEIVFTKLADAQWWHWPQRDAVAEFLAAFWSRTQEDYPAHPAIGQTLCALGCTGADMTPYLAEWEGLTGEPALRHLHEFATSELTWKRGRPRLSNTFWDPAGEPHRQVVAWLTEGPALAALNAAFARTGREDLLPLFAETEQALSW